MASRFDFAMRSELENCLRRLRVAGLRSEIECPIGSFEPAGVVAQFRKNRDEPLLRPVLREAAIHRVDFRWSAQCTLDEVGEAHDVLSLNTIASVSFEKILLPVQLIRSRAARAIRFSAATMNTGFADRATTAEATSFSRIANAISAGQMNHAIQNRNGTPLP